MNNKSIVLLLAGGTGTRLGADIPKQYIKVNDRMIIDHCMESVLKCGMIAGVWIVADEMWHGEIKASCKDEGRLLGFSAPGTSRAGSIENGIRDIWDYLAKEGKAESADLSERIVIIHDAARPLASVDLLSRLISACDEYDGAMPVLPMKDTIYFSENGSSISSLLDRGKLFAGQAPEAYRYGKYKSACAV